MIPVVPVKEFDSFEFCGKKLLVNLANEASYFSRYSFSFSISQFLHQFRRGVPQMSTSVYSEMEIQGDLGCCTATHVLIYSTHCFAERIVGRAGFSGHS
jgi:hypothetical protein